MSRCLRWLLAFRRLSNRLAIDGSLVVIPAPERGSTSRETPGNTVSNKRIELSPVVRLDHAGLTGTLQFQTNAVGCGNYHELGYRRRFHQCAYGVVYEQCSGRLAANSFRLVFP